MGRYIDEILQPGERVLYSTNEHTDPTPGLWASQQTRVTGYACAPARSISTCTVA
jgi:hypothetical protein